MIHKNAESWKLNESAAGIKYSVEDDDDGDRTTITATLSGKSVGSVTTEVIFGYSFEFDDVLSEDEFAELYPDDRIVKIEHVKVEDAHKGTGIATELMNRVIALMRERGYDQFYLNASPMGTDGLRLADLVRFYEKFGFRTFKDQGRNVLMCMTDVK